MIIVGPGLAGLTAALELAARGVRTLLLDDDNPVGASGRSSRGICYAKRTLEILDRFGVAERVRAKGVTWNEGEVFRDAGFFTASTCSPRAIRNSPPSSTCSSSTRYSTRVDNYGGVLDAIKGVATTRPR